MKKKVTQWICPIVGQHLKTRKGMYKVTGIWRDEYLNVKSIVLEDIAGVEIEVPKNDFKAMEPNIEYIDID